MTRAAQPPRRTDRFLHDVNGNLVIAQAPNLPLIGWLVCTILRWLLPDGNIGTALGHTGRAFLFTWAYLELTEGVNYFRRMIGLVVIAAIIIGFFRR